MLLHVALFGESFAAHFAHVRSFTGVRSHVIGQLASLIEKSAAQVAFVTHTRLVRSEAARFDRVPELVRFTTGQITEIFGAQRTLEPQILVQFVVGLKGAPVLEPTFAHRARVRPFLGVGHHVHAHIMDLLGLMIADATNNWFAIVYVTDMQFQHNWIDKRT